MIEITSTELRRNMGKYLELVVENKEQVLVRYRKKRVFSLTLEPIKGGRIEKAEKNDKYFEQPEVLQSILRGREDVKAGRVRKFTTVKNLWDGIQ